MVADEPVLLQPVPLPPKARRSQPGSDEKALTIGRKGFLKQLPQQREGTERNSPRAPGCLARAGCLEVAASREGRKGGDGEEGCAGSLSSGSRGLRSE